MNWSLTAAEMEALALSFKVALTAVFCALPFAIAAGWMLSRRFTGRAVADALIHLPLVLPPVVIGYLLLVSFGARAPLGAWLDNTFGLRFVFSWHGAALASAIVTFPFQVRAIRLAMEAVDPKLLEAAETLGAGPFDRFRSISLPLAAPGILAGAVTAFAACLGQFGAIITFVANIPGETRTLPLAIYTAIQTPGGEAAALRLVLLAIALAFAGLIISEWLARRLHRTDRG